MAKKKKAGKKKGSRASSTIPHLFTALIGFLVLAADQYSKYLTYYSIPRMTHENQWYPYGGIGVFEDFFGIEFSIVHTINYGAAWGVLSDFQNYLLAFRALFIAVLIGYLVFYNTKKVLELPLTLVAAGAIGNLIDTLVYGHVVDMFHFVFWGYSYPVFNIADSAICIGIFSTVILSSASCKLKYA